jgi:hypothetical protein
MLIMDVTPDGSIRRQCWIWFAEAPFRPAGYDTVCFKEARVAVSDEQFTQSEFPTLFSDLRLPEDEMWQQIHKGKQKDIRLARNRGWTFSGGQTLADIERFHGLQTIFATTKNIGPPLPAAVLQRNAEHCYYVFGNDREGRTVCWISYVLDKPIARALFTGYDLTHDVSAIGYGTSLMHWEMMLHFKRKEFEIYDWGGAPLDPALPVYSITRFKLRFGGTPVTLFDYVCRRRLSRSRRLWRQVLLWWERFGMRRICMSY